MPAAHESQNPAEKHSPKLDSLDVPLSQPPYSFYMLKYNTKTRFDEEKSRSDLDMRVETMFLCRASDRRLLLSVIDERLG